ncbi:MAG: Stp1/IreP family PP2C-type Ser/Thr phosphatase [Syntrophaceae bacterium]
MAQKTMCAGMTDVGLKRGNNEDAFILRPDLGFCAVADGMGGAAAGEVASRIFVETAQAVFENSAPHVSRLDCVQQAFTLANQRILEHIALNPGHRGMGCTAELIAFSDAGIVIGHIGDSRTYRLRDAELRQLTQDHSLVQDQINQGLISPDEARTHAMRHVILRAVGTRDTIELDILKGKGRPGDIFLLCSDGLTDMVTDEAITETLIQGGDPTAMAGRLIELAKAAGGLDNITVALIVVANA